MEMVVNVADRINEVYALSEKAASSAIDYAIQIGELLTEAKAGMVHGTWIPWVDANLKFKSDQASRYMRLAGYKKEIEANASLKTDLNILSLLKQLTPPKPEPAIPAQKPAAVPPLPKDEVIVPVPVPQAAEVAAVPVVPPKLDVAADDGMMYLSREEYEEVKCDAERWSNVSVILNGDQPLIDATDEVVALSAQVAALTARQNGLIAEKNQAIKQVKYWKKRAEKLETELGVYKVAEVGL